MTWWGKTKQTIKIIKIWTGPENQRRADDAVYGYAAGDDWEAGSGNREGENQNRLDKTGEQQCKATDRRSQDGFEATGSQERICDARKDNLKNQEYEW